MCVFCVYISCTSQKKVVPLHPISIERMKKQILYFALVVLLVGCNSRDVQRIEQAESLLYTNRDSAELLLRQVERPERLDEEHLAKYWFVTCDLRANSMQSLSEDSMICWAAEYYRHQWLKEHGDARAMILSGLEEAMYWWWNGDKEKAQQVLARQKTYADEVAELTGDHLWQTIILRVSGELAMRDYDYERVRECTETLIGLDDGSAIHLDEVERVYNALAIVYFSLGEYDKMEDAFRKAIENAVDSVFVVNVVQRNYADLLGEIGQTDRAIRMQEELAEQYRKADNWLLVESLYSLSRLWLNKGDKHRADLYMREAEDLFRRYKEQLIEFDPATEAALLAHRQVLDYALNGKYDCYPLVQHNNRWSESDYVRFRVAEAKERSIRDLNERNLYLTISRQRLVIVLVLSLFFTLGLLFLFLYLYNRRKRLLLLKDEEIETLQNMLGNHASAETENVQQLMLRQLGLIKTIAGSPTEGNQQLLAQLTAMDESKASALMDWSSIYRTIDVAYDGFHTHVVEQYGEMLNEKEIQLCCLLRAGFSTKEINMLTRQSMQTIYQRKTQVRQKLGMQDGDDIVERITNYKQNKTI